MSKKLSLYFTKRPKFLQESVPEECKKSKQEIAQDMQEYILDYIPLHMIIDKKLLGKSSYGKYDNKDINLLYLMKRKQEKAILMNEIYQDVYHKINSILYDYYFYYRIQCQNPRDYKYYEPWKYNNLPYLPVYFRIIRLHNETEQIIKNWLQYTENEIVLESLFFDNIKPSYNAQHKNLKSQIELIHKSKEFKEKEKNFVQDYKGYNQKEFFLWLKTDYFHFYGYFTKTYYFEAINFELVPIEPTKDDEMNKKDIYKIYKKLIEQIHKDFLHTIENIHEVNNYGINYFQFDEKMV